MNIFNAKLEKRGDGVYATFGNNAIKVPTGKQKFVDAGGRVDKFKRRLQASGK